MNTSSTSDYVSHLKQSGFSSTEIMVAVSIKTQGITMTRCIEKFTRYYDNGKIDGFPDSSIEVLESFYGYKTLKKMKPETLISKVETLQKCLTSDIDPDFIKESVLFYLS